MRASRLVRALVTGLLAQTCAAGAVHAQRSSTVPESAYSVEQLLSQGWEIVGFGAIALESRSFILFRNKDQKFLVQCSVRYDVTRNPRVITNCYEVR